MRNYSFRLNPLVHRVNRFSIQEKLLNTKNNENLYSKRNRDENKTNDRKHNLVVGTGPTGYPTRKGEDLV